MLTLTAPTEADADAIRALFRGFPYRAFQQRRQRIDPGQLASMLWDQTRRAMAQPECDFAAARAGAELLGLAGLAPDTWHSEVFAMPMARIQPFLIYPRPSLVGPELLASILNDARRRGYAHLSCRLDASDWAAIHVLEADGFYLVDGSQKLTRRLGGPAAPPLAECAAPEGLSLDDLRPGEEDALAALASRSHDTNHFFNDPALKRDAAQRLFEEWVRRCCRGLARHVFVARRDGTPVGFVTYLGAPALEKRLGLRIIILDFIVIDRAEQGHGMGRWLLGETLRRLAGAYDWVELRTSYNNYPALALYHRMGFETIASDVILHKRLR